MKSERFRPGQREAYQTILNRVRAGQKEIGIILPTGYGKSDVIRATALQLYREGLVCCSLVISPNDYLRGQMVDEERFNGFLSRYGIRQEFGRPLAYGALPTIPKDFRNLRPNGEFLLSTTIQLIQSSDPIRFFPNWIEHECYVTGLPVATFVDETHTYTKRNRWGDCIFRIRDGGSYVIVLTATAIREDGDEIIGFRYHEERNEPYQYTTTRPGKTPETRIVDLYTGKKTYYQLEADYSYTFSDAWNEPVSPICYINKIDVDIDLKSEYPDSDDIPRCMLSEVPAWRAAQLIGRLVWNAQVIHKGCEELVYWLRKVRSAGPECRNCAAIIFTASDNDDNGDEVNAHAEQIKRILHTIAPSLKVVIATSANTGKGNTGKEILEAFVNEDRGDIIIVKAMAGLGYDCPRIKVGLDLSPVRSVSSVIQRMNRAGRPYAGLYVMYWITLADQVMQGVFQKFVADAGGAAVADTDLVESWEIKVKDQQKPTVIVFGAQTNAVTDTFNQTIGPRELIVALRFLEEVPELIGRRTLPEIAGIAGRLGIVADTLSTEGAAINTSNVAHDIRTQIHEIAKPFINVMFQRKHGRRYAGAQDSELHREISRAFWREAYMLAGIAYEELGKISDLEKLQRMLNAWMQIVEREADRERA